jgi:hypothetical protein
MRHLIAEENGISQCQREFQPDVYGVFKMEKGPSVRSRARIF